MNKCYYCKKAVGKHGIEIYPSSHGKAMICLTCKIAGLKKLLIQSKNLKGVLERKIINTNKEINDLQVLNK